MTLYVVRVADPPPGTDWRAMVPGQYLYDITGITATLSTGINTPTLAMKDSGLALLDGTYKNVPTAAPPIVSGIPATRFSDGITSQGVVADPIITWLADWSIEAWFRRSTALGVPVVQAQDGTGAVTTVNFQASIDASGALFVSGGPSAGVDAFWITAAGVFPFDGDGHQVVFTYDSGADVVSCYLDGNPVTITNMFGNPFNLAGIDHVGIMGPVFGSAGTSPYVGAQVSIYDHGLSSVEVFNHFVARNVGPAYVAMVLGDNPAAYYQLNDQGAVGGGRTPALTVTDGTTEVVRVGDGFPATPLNGPYAYSWQPRLPADTQTPDGLVTTVGIPRLILPAGYTIGTRTPDLAGTDQWSDIAVWWDDSYQNSTIALQRYAFPPGATLRPY